jgi:ribosome production factor 2
MRTGHDMHPIDDILPVEAMSHKHNSSLFVCGTHQKKRPDNIFFGRTFAHHLLDLFEF